MTIIFSVLSVLLLYTSVESVNPRFYPKYHLAPPSGWMNDPNGFCMFRGEYHLFYQYNPNSSQVPGIANWGHAKSSDLFNWTHLPIAMEPDEDYDTSGVFSGSALVENNIMYLFYTGNVNHEGETPDHEQHQALAWSNDGVTITKYEGNPIIEGKNRQPNFRDPKVWKHGDTYYMVLGNSFTVNNNTEGRALLYASKDKYHWKEVSILDQSYGYLGFMWECPDFFELNGYFVLLFSPQGIEPQGIRYNNLYQTGYLVGFFDYRSLKFTPVTEFRELDFGHDFYATQTTLNNKGETVMVAWADMWEEYYPERNDGFTGHMTIPRILTLDRQLRLIQKPVTQIQNAIGKRIRNGKILSDTAVKLEDNAGKIDVKAPGNQNFTLILESNNQPTVIISYDCNGGLVTLDRGGEDGKRSTKWRPKDNLLWTVYVDSSSVEVFVGDGEATFTSRIFPDGAVGVRVGENCQADDLSVYAMKQTVSSPPRT